MLDFEYSNGKLYYFTCGALGRYYDGLFQPGRQADESDHQLYYNIMLNDYEAQSRVVENWKQKAKAFEKANAMLTNEINYLKSLIHNAVKKEQSNGQ